MGTNRIFRFDLGFGGGAITQEPLTDPGGLYVWVSRLDPEVEGFGLSREELSQEVEHRVLAAGIPLLGTKELLTTPLLPCLGVLVNIDRTKSTPPHYLYSIEVFFVTADKKQERDTPSPLKMVWSREARGDVRCTARCELDWSSVLDTVGTLVDRFINDYLAGARAFSGPDRLN
jgi:hypothetical protein